MNYRAIPHQGGLIVVEKRANKYSEYEYEGTAVQYSTGVVSYDGVNYKSVRHMIAELEKEGK